MMMHRLAICLALASLTFASPRPVAAAGLTAVFDTVDAVEITVTTGSLIPTVVVTGILTGQSAPTTLSFTFPTDSSVGITDMAARCERFAVIAMSKPGKFQFAIGSVSLTSVTGGCKLILRTP